MAITVFWGAVIGIENPWKTIGKKTGRIEIRPARFRTERFAYL
jgi:hypothetical protein